jgi:hypothetical protein
MIINSTSEPVNLHWNIIIPEMVNSHYTIAISHNNESDQILHNNLCVKLDHENSNVKPSGRAKQIDASLKIYDKTEP